jgi:MoaA/NifB/PqqE/SkfB family radical SAM enzyme
VPALLRKIRVKLYERKGGIAPIRVPALIKSLEKTGKVFRIGFTGGEPFLIPNFVEACAALTKKHFISLNTNFITGETAEFAGKINPQRVVKITASLHIKELERLGLLGKYVEHYHLYLEKGFRLYAQEVAYPALQWEAEGYKKYFHERGVELKFYPFQGYYDGRLYPEAYTSAELRSFGLDRSCLDSFNLKGKACNTGFNAGVVSPAGDIRPCYQRNREIGNIYGKIGFEDKLTTCPFNFCTCPFPAFESGLLPEPLRLLRAKHEPSVPEGAGPSWSGNE